MTATSCRSRNGTSILVSVNRYVYGYLYRETWVNPTFLHGLARVVQEEADRAVGIATAAGCRSRDGMCMLESGLRVNPYACVQQSG